MQLQGRELKIRMKGEDVALLQQELTQLGYQIPEDEQSKNYFGSGTRRAVLELQRQRGLKATGVVDSATLKAISVGPQKALAEIMPDGHLVEGYVRDENGKPVNNISIHVVDKDVNGENMLGDTRTDKKGYYKLEFTESKFRYSDKEKDGPDLVVSVVDPAGTTLAASRRIGNASTREKVDLTIPSRQEVTYPITGKVFSRLSAGIGGLQVSIVDKNVNGDVLLAKAITDDNGMYHVTFTDADLRERGKTIPDLQARVHAGETLLGASEVHYNATSSKNLNVLLEDHAASRLRSEHEVLTSTVARQFTGFLRDLKETDHDHDITYLANKTGWDARLIALAALADQFSARTRGANDVPAIPPPFFYALFRAGLPANEDTLYHTDPKTLGAIWKQAVEQNIIDTESANQIPNLVERFQALRAQKLLTQPALIGASSFQEILTVSRLNEAQQATFAELYAAHSTDMPAFWKAVSEAFGQDMSNQLQVDGKLAYLTVNNAPLMQKVYTAINEPLLDLLQLAQTGYYRADVWSQLLTPDIPLPSEIAGETPEAQRANYAEYLAAQVRFSYPTASIAHMIKTGELPLLGAAPDVAEQVFAFLNKHQGKFEVGVQPIEQYIAKNNLQVATETRIQIARVHRVSQIAPSDQAMIGLMKRGIDAAYHIVGYDKDTFVQVFAADLGGADQATITYDRAVQIHNVILNITLGYLNARTAPAIGVHSPAGIVNPIPANAGDVIAYAKLEQLFGSMDFCACDHCRSILSPAAYLVDLLSFLYADEQKWKEFCNKWHQKHGGARYPFLSMGEWIFKNKPTNTEISPLNVLLSRRPDIEHLPLTCENTNTALPYLDIVNETLEYYVANDSQKLSLKDYHGHDTNGVASEDLLASPQYVMDSAYTILHDEKFPPPLPFHQPLENLRRYFNKFEVLLPLVMERIRKSDTLDHGANLYGWRDILMEELGLSRSEYDILTDSKKVPIEQLYGFAQGADVIGNLSNAKAFCRRIGITYEELVTMIKTQFINPNCDLIPKLERLGVSFTTLAELKTKDDAATDATFDALLAGLAQPPDPAAYGGDPNASKNNYKPIRDWVKNEGNYARIMRLIILTDLTNSTDSCSFDNLEFRYSKPITSAGDTSTRLGNFEFVRLLRFIRLWKKLGWTIEQTDAAIMALYPANPLGETDLDKLDNAVRGVLPRLGVVKRVLQALNLNLKRDLLSLLACWSNLSTHGDNALYRHMFLNPTLLKQDNIFDDNGYGEFLTGQSQMLLSHEPALRSAFNLAEDEFTLIISDLPLDAKLIDRDQDKNLLLTLRNVSAIYCRGWLARKLKLSVRELLLLIKLTRHDPFGDPAPTDPMNPQLMIYPSILRLISLVQALKDRSLKSAAALYLIWNQDLSGKSAPDSVQVAAFVRTLRLTFANVEAEFSVRDDPDGTIARARMALVYGTDATNFLFSLLDDSLVTEVTLEYSPTQVPLVTNVAYKRAPITLVSYVPYKHHQANLEQAILTAAPQLTYDDLQQELSYTDELTEIIVTALKDAADSVIAESDARLLFKSAVDNLYEENQRVIAANLQQPIVDAAPGLLYEEAQQPQQLSFAGTLSATTANALKDAADRAIIDGDANLLFKNAVDTLYKENQKVIKSNLEQQIVDSVSGRIAYDDFRKRLSFTGALPTSMLGASNTLKAAADIVISNTKARDAFKSAVDELFNKNQSIVDAFFDRYPELRPLYEAYAFFLELHSSVAYIQPQAELDGSIRDAAPGRITYDGNAEQLSYTGVMSKAIADALKQASGATQGFKNAVDSLYTDNQTAIEKFFNDYPSLVSKNDDYLLADNSLARQRSLLLEVILPDLKRRRKEQQALLAVSAVAQTDLDFARTILASAPYPIHASRAYLFTLSLDLAGDLDILLPSDKLRAQFRANNRLLSQQAQVKVNEAASSWIVVDGNVEYAIRKENQQLKVYLNQPALNDILGLETPGLSVKFFGSETLPEDDNALENLIPNTPTIAANLNYSDKPDANPLPKNSMTPGAAISAKWEGYLEAPDSGFFNLHIKADTDAAVTLLLDNKPITLTQNKTIWNNTDPIELRAGTLYPITLKVEKVSKVMSVQWEWEPKGVGRVVIPARYLYPAVSFRAFKDVYIHFLKSTSLAVGLGLTANELAYFATHPDYYINADGWLNALSVSGDPETPTAAALLKPFEALLDFSRIKADISAGDESLLAVLQNPAATTPNKQSLLLTITCWDSASLDALLVQFGKVRADGTADHNALKSPETFVRVYDTFGLIQKMGISAKALIQAATNEPTAETVRDLQAALRARYDSAAWRDVVQPINDQMRSLQREALVAYILHQMQSYPESAPIDTPEKLFEYFLMDVEMDPCMQTSRVRHALSSVQLFIERCLMKLEPRVFPTAIDAQQWEWMKRYRVWEANRKVYLWPENWLEPELRDDKSPFFKEIESELLQSDITEDSATTALLNYLSKLEEVAKLEPCGIYHDEDRNIDHVIARTTGAHRKYYYRRYEFGSWTAWEQIKLDIEDNPVIPVIWNDRLLLFWLRILKKGLDTVQIPFSNAGGETSLNSLTVSKIDTDPPPVMVQAVLCWSEYYNNKWQPTKTSDINHPTFLLQSNPSGPHAFSRANLVLTAIPEVKGLRVRIFNSYSGWGTDVAPQSSFLLYNTHSLPVPQEETGPVPFSPVKQWRFLPGQFAANDDLEIYYWNDKKALKYELLLGELPIKITRPDQSFQSPWTAPFFCEDSHHVFFVTTTKEPVQIKNILSFGVQLGTKVSDKVKIRPLVLQTAQDFVGPPRPTESPIQLISGALDYRSNIRFLSEDAFIDQGKATTGTVTYGTVQIGPSGVISKNRVAI